MPARRMLRKMAIWSGIAVLLLAALYTSTYFRVCSPVNVAESVIDEHGEVHVYVKVEPLYSVPWPAASTFNQPWTRGKLRAWFDPAHQLDRRLRSDVWKKVQAVSTVADNKRNSDAAD